MVMGVYYFYGLRPAGSWSWELEVEVGLMHWRMMAPGPWQDLKPEPEQGARSREQGAAKQSAKHLALAHWHMIIARMVPIGPGGLQSGFSILRYARRDFRQKKSGPRTPRPPGGPPVLGSLVLGVARGRAA
jgi:hypothetical protein